MKSPFHVLSSREIYRNPWISVREDKVRRQGAHRDQIFGIIRMASGVSILPVTGDGQVYLVKEFKYGANLQSIEVISGGIEQGESPQQAAERELREEAGLIASEWKSFGWIRPYTTVVDGCQHLFEARGLDSAPASNDPEEPVERVCLPLSRAMEMIESGEINHGPTCILILRSFLAGR